MILVTSLCSMMGRMIPLREVPQGVQLWIKVLPGSRQTEFRGIHDGAIKVSVTAAPEKGKANKAAIQFLANQWELPKSVFSIVSGATDSRKSVLIQGISATELHGRIEQASRNP